MKKRRRVKIAQRFVGVDKDKIKLVGSLPIRRMVRLASHLTTSRRKSQSTLPRHDIGIRGRVNMSSEENTSIKKTGDFF